MLGFIILLVFLLFGSAMQVVFSLPIPAAILGMLALLLFLLARGLLSPNRSEPESLAHISRLLSPFLPLFLVPISVGLITQLDIVREYGWQLLLILAASLIPGILVCALCLRGIRS